MEITNELLAKVQNIELEILKEVIRVCEEHHLQYYLDAGTCLGAMRHQGFIPWDDDVDIAMPRVDYEKFKMIFPTVCDRKFFLHLRGNDKLYSSPFLKVRKNGTEFGSEADKKLCHMGVWIDIFCVDSISVNKRDSAFRYKKFKDSCLALYANKLLDKSKRTKKWNLICHLIPMNLLKLIEEQIDKKWLSYLKASDEKKVYVSFSTTYTLDKVIYDEEVLFPVRKIKFCDIEATVPNDYNAFLTIMYGDWHKLPPEDKRTSHHDISYIKL